MFEDENVIKMKKDQFIEAESVAYLVEDELKRKLAFANTCCLFAFKNYAEKNKYKYEPVTNINLFRVPMVVQKYGISDLYLGNARIDVRASLDGKVFPVPKCHIKNSLAADFYVVFKGTKNPLKCEGIGYIKKEDLIFDSQDDEYYYISVAILNPLADLKAEINNFQKEPKTFYETEHRLSHENFGAFLDGELDEVKSLDLIEHLIECENCRAVFVEYSFLEDVLTAVQYYPDLKSKIENFIEEKEKVQEPVVELAEENASEPENVIEPEIVPVIVPAEEITEIVSGETAPEETPFEETVSEESSDEGIIVDEIETDNILTDEITIDETPTEVEEYNFDDVSVENVSEEEENILAQENVTMEELPQEETLSNNSGLLYEENEETLTENADAEEPTDTMTTETTDEEEKTPMLLYEDVSEPTINEEEDNSPVLKYDFSKHQQQQQQEEPVETQELSDESISIDNDDLITFDDTEIIETNEAVGYKAESENNNQDEYSITESNEETNAVNDSSDDEELNNFLLNDINKHTEEIQSNEEISFESPQPAAENIDQEEVTEFNFDDSPNEAAFTDNLKEEPLNNTNGSKESELDIVDEEDSQNISFEDIFNDDDIEIKNDAAENIQNDEELQNILNDTTSSADIQEEISTSNWNQLFTTNASKTIEQEDIEINDVPVADNISPQVQNEFAGQDNTLNDNSANGLDSGLDSELNGNIETLYEQQTEDDNLQQNDINQVLEQAVDNTNTKTVKEEKKSSGGIIAVVVVMLAILLIALGGVAYYGFNNMENKIGNISKMPSSNQDNSYNDNGNDMNRVMTDAFADNSAGVTVTKMAWEKNKSATMTKDLESYLNTTASSIWDNLETDLVPVQGYSASQPSKISILINKDGEVKNIKVAQSCGSKDIDNVVLKSVKKVIESIPPTAYSIKGENINLTLVVNF